MSISRVSALQNPLLAGGLNDGQFLIPIVVLLALWHFWREVSY